MKGSQEPRIFVGPEWTSTDGLDASALSAEYGNKLDPWQENIVDEWLGKNNSGKYVVSSAGLSVPRQNGKNVCLEARELFGMAINGERILHTAHQVKTAKKSFHRLEAIFTDQRHPEILELVKHISHVNGEESIDLWNGGRIEFSARSRQAARGFDGISLVVYDEAQELTDDQVEAIMPTLAASATGTRQILYIGTPPYPGCPGTVFRRIRKAAMTNPGPHDCWMEWSVEAKSVDEIDVNKFSLWYMTNPSMGFHLSEDFTATELKTMSKDGFARERLGWWMPEITDQSEKALDAKKWAACASDEAKPEGKTAYGIKFSTDGSMVCLCGAVIPKEGPARISLIEMKPTGYGLDWLAAWLNERYKYASCVVIDGRNGVDVLVEKISGVWRLKGTVIRPTAREMIAAVSTLVNGVNEQALTWYSKQEIMNESAVSSVRRPIGGGWGFGGEKSIPIEAAALALWGAKTSRRDPTRKMRCG